MNCAHFLMGYHSKVPVGNKVISDKMDEYMSKTEKTLLDNLEFMIFIAGAYDDCKYKQVSAKIIHNLLNIADDEVRAVYYENIMENECLGEICQYIYTNREEILELSEEMKYYLNIVYICGDEFLCFYKEINDIITIYKEKDYTGYNILYMNELIKYYGGSSFKLRPF